MSSGTVNGNSFSVVHSFPVDSATLKITGQGADSVHPVTGRLYADVMGMAGADGLVRPGREKDEQPDKALEVLKIEPGSTVADIGAGVGYYSWRLAKIVGPSGKVYANEIQSEMIEKIRKNMAERSITNVEPVLGKVDDPELPKGAIDLALMVDVYHELAQPQKMLDRIRASLKPEGRLVLIEYRKESYALPIGALHAMTVEEAKAEVEPEGFKFDEVLETLPTQHIIIFKRRPN
jgi:precorrin-6B methylase 2